MLALAWNSPGAEQFTKRVRVIELGNDHNGRRFLAEKLQCRHFPLRLRIISNGDANNILPFDLVGNQNLRLFIFGQEIGVIWTACECETSGSFGSCGKQLFECLWSFANQPSMW